jgi:CDP-diglyceride synthetase
MRAVEKGSRSRRRVILWSWRAFLILAVAAEIFGLQYEPVRHRSGDVAWAFLLLASIVWVPLVTYGVVVAWRDPMRRGQQAQHIGYCFLALFVLHAAYMCQQSVPAAFASHLIVKAEAYNASMAIVPSNSPTWES